MQPFQFHRPGSTDEALAAIRDATGGKFLAGGQSLLPVMKLDLAAPTDLVSLADMEELRGIRREGDTLVVGATTTHAEVAESGEVRGAIPALADMAGRIGDPQVRNRGTLGGSVAHNDPAADYPAAVLGLGAAVVTDRREISADDYFQGLFTTALEEDELITAVRFPIPETAAYAKFASPASRYALVGVMVAGGSSGVRVAVTGARRGVYRWTEAEQALAGGFSVDAVASLTHPADGVVGDDEASAEYRAHLVEVMTRRAVGRCA